MATKYFGRDNIDLVPLADRTTLDESKSMSKNVRRYGPQGSKIDATYKSTGGHQVHESEVPPSKPAQSNTGRLPNGGVVKTVGHAPDASGKYLKPDYGKTTRVHGADGFHAVRTDGASGQMHSASGGKFGEPTKRPASPKNTGTTRRDAGALAGNPGDRSRYSGGRGPI